MRIMCVMLVLGLLTGCSASTTALVQDPDRGATILNAALTCGIKDGQNQCWTPSKQLNAGTWDSERFDYDWATPPGWVLTGGARAVYSGREVFDVTVLGWSSKSLHCQWHTEGSKQPFGPGGYVIGYCIANAVQAPVGK
jgi:hypothetical protein